MTAHALVAFDLDAESGRAILGLLDGEVFRIEDEIKEMARRQAYQNDS